MAELTTDVPDLSAEIVDVTTELLLAALDDLPDGFNAEIVDDQIHLMSPTGRRPNRAAMRIVVSLEREEARTGGQAFSGGIGFFLPTPRRRSFSPDASFSNVPLVGDASDMDYIAGAPAFAVEVRSKSDYGLRMEA